MAFSYRHGTPAINRLTIVIFFVVLYSGKSFSDIPDTIKILPDFKSAEIGKSCLLRENIYFESYHNTTEKWRKITTPNVFLMPDTIHWIFGIIQNSSSYDKRLKLYLHNVQLDFAQLYVVDDGKIDSTQITGCLLPIKKRATTDRTLSLPFIIPAGQSIELYLKGFRRESGATLTLTLHDPATGHHFAWMDNLWAGILGFIVLIVFMALILLLFYPHKENYWYLFYIFLGGLYMVAVSGYGSMYLWGQWPWFEQNAAVFLAGMSTFGFIQFCRIVLEVKTFNIWIDRFLILAASIHLLAGIAGFGLFFDWYPGGTISRILQIVYLIDIVSMCGIMYIGLYKALVRKKKEYWWFVAIFVFYFSFSFVTICFEIGIIPFTPRLHMLNAVLCSTPQLFLPLVFLVNRAVVLLRENARIIENIRLEIAQDIHDEVGSGLTKISYGARVAAMLNTTVSKELKEHLIQISRGAADITEHLNDIVFAISPQYDTFSEMAAYFREKGGIFFEGTGIAFTFLIQGNHDSRLSLLVKRQLYMIYREVLNNVIKHADAKTVAVLFRIESDNHFLLQISDDGKGFNPDDIRHFGNGLKGIRLRAGRIMAKANVSSSPGQGVTVSISGVF